MVGRATVRVHAAVASSAVRLSKVQELASPEAYLPTAEEAIQFPICPDRHQPRFWTRSGGPYVEAVYSWMQHAFASDQVAEEPLRWISVVHLLFSFHRFTGVIPPWYDPRTRRWTRIGQFTRPEIARPHVGVLTAAFCRHLRECVVAQGGVWLTADRRPHSSALQIKVRTVPTVANPFHWSPSMRSSFGGFLEVSVADAPLLGRHFGCELARATSALPPELRSAVEWQVESGLGLCSGLLYWFFGRCFVFWCFEGLKC